eukprot:5919834-Alexandrium_andersonii.AAC.1
MLLPSRNSRATSALIAQLSKLRLVSLGDGLVGGLSARRHPFPDRSRKIAAGRKMGRDSRLFTPPLRQTADERLD